MRRATLRTSFRLGALALALFWPAVAAATDYYVAPAPTGSDSNPGTSEAPFASMARGQTAAAAGDTVYFKGGTYAYTAGTTTCSSGTATISGVVLSKSGSAGNLIKYWAVPGEKPVFDFDGIRDSCRIKGILVSASFVHIKGLELRGVRQNNNLNHESWGLWNQGSDNIFEALDVHHIMGAGIFLQNGGNNLVLNCDAHDNLDELTSNGAGESADGFGCHVGANQGGNVFRGCRAWWNADDGYDFINSKSACLVEDSWAWYNGYEPGTLDGIGNGNGFKAGGYGADPTTFPADPSEHTVQNCLSVANKAAGFYANHHPDTLYFYSNTAYDNHPNFNMLGMNYNGDDITVGEYRNNLAFQGTPFSNGNGADDANNSWTLGVTVAVDDFEGPSVTGLDAARQPDGSLPVLANFQLASSSDLIDVGVDVGLPYAGSAPDLGAFEFGLAPSGTGGGASSSGGTTGGGGAGPGTGVGGTSASGSTTGGGGGLGTGVGGTSASGGGFPNSGGLTGSGGEPLAEGGSPDGDDAAAPSGGTPAGCACDIGAPGRRPSNLAFLLLALLGVAAGTLKRFRS